MSLNCPGRVNPGCTCDGGCKGQSGVSSWGWSGGKCSCVLCRKSSSPPFPGGTNSTSGSGGGSIAISGGSSAGGGSASSPGSAGGAGGGSASPPGSAGGGGGSSAGGIVSASGVASYASPGPLIGANPVRGNGAGMTGFAETGELDFEPGFDLKPVRGLRQWTLKSPDFRGDPLSADCGGWTVSPLTGMTGYAWADGVLEAYCGNGYDHVPPVESVTEPRGSTVRDGCGFWAYWSMTELAGNSSFSGSGGLPVLGLIQGYGRVLLGERGFRSQRAQIVALAPAFSVQAEVTPPWQQPGRSTNPYTYKNSNDPYLQFSEEHKREEETEEIRQRAQRHADAWMAVITDRLGEMYPSARVFATAAGLLASVPPEGKPE